MKFVKVRFWTWEHFFSGEMGIQTKLDATEEQVRKYIERNTSRGGNGNYDQSSLKTGITKLKISKVNIVNLD